jgi:putative ABC transport system substrate-binding protein
MKRRDFITLLGGAAAAWPLAARAQQPAMPVIGYLSPTVPNERMLAVFRKSLAEGGYIEGRNIAVEYRWAEGRYDRLPEMAMELVRRKVAVIVASPTPSALAAKAATATVPIVFGVTDDPVRLGLATSLARPDGNATGVYFFLSDLAAKQLGLIRELAPTAERIGLLVNPDNANAEAVTREMMAAASATGVQIEVIRASDSSAIHAAFATLVRNKTDALVVAADQPTGAAHHAGDALSDPDRLYCSGIRRGGGTHELWREPH